MERGVAESRAELGGEGAGVLLARARRLPRLELAGPELADLLLLGWGAYRPLQGFLTRDDYHSVLAELRLASGQVWPLPITLAAGPEQVRALRGAEEVALCEPGGRIVGLLVVADVYTAPAAEEARLVYGTADPSHPGVSRLLSRGPTLLGGPVTLLAVPSLAAAAWALSPGQVRAEIQRRGWRQVAGFQTRNPVHRAHEYIQKCALEICDGLLLHPLAGETKAGDVPADVRRECYRVLLAGYYPPGRVLLTAFPASMRYAGPREALFHALCRRNYGCTHFIVGRDHAGVGGFYGPYDAQRIFDRFTPAELGVTPLFFEDAFYCRRCAQMATAKTCPHPPASRVSLSGTRVRALLRAGKLPPAELTRPEVAAILARALAGDQGAGGIPPVPPTMID